MTAPLPHLAAQGPTAVEEVTEVSRALRSALRQGDGAAAAAHLAEDVAATAAPRVRGLHLAPEHFSRAGEVVVETGSYSGRMAAGRCEMEFVEPKTQRQARDRLLCGSTPSLAREEGAYRMTWARSPGGTWRVRRIETEANPQP